MKTEKLFKRNSLQFKFIAANTLLIVMIVFGISFVFLINEFYHAKRQLRGEAFLIGKSLAQSSLPALLTSNPQLLSQAIQGYSNQPNIKSAYIVNSKGIIMAHTDSRYFGESLNPEELKKALSGNEPTFVEDLRSEVIRVTYPLSLADKKWGFVGVEYSAKPLKKQLTVMVTETIFITTLFIVFGFWLGSIFSNKITNPLSELSRAAQALQEGSFDIGMEEETPPTDEVAFLRSRFVQMARALKGNQEELKEKNLELEMLNKELGKRVQDATEELIKTTDYLSYILRSTDEGIITTDQQGRITMVNRAAHDLFGYSEDDLLKRPLAELFNDAQLAEGRIRNTISTGNINRFEADILGGTGTNRNAFSSIAALKDYRGDTLGVVAVVADLTEKKRYEEHLNRSAKLASIGELAAGLAHEINNILAVIHGFIDVLTRETEGQGQIGDDLKIMKREAGRGQEILKRLLTFARPAEPKMALNDLHEIIDSSLVLLQYEIKQNRVSVQKNYCGNMPPILSDGEQLKQVFMNIILNAAQMLPKGGNITISSRVTDDGYMEVELKDDGPGIRQEDLPRIFDPFFTTKAPGKGTGLGLAIAYRIVDSHGGWMSVASAPGEGASFTIRLPLERKQEPSPALKAHSGLSGEPLMDSGRPMEERGHA